MWEKQESVRSAAPREAIWAIWADVDRWGEWNPNVKWARCDGPFAAGTTGKLKPTRGPASSFEISELESDRRWVYATRLPGACLRIEHLLGEDAEGRSHITYHARLNGPLSAVYSRLMDKPLTGAVAAVHQLAAHAERGSSRGLAPRSG